MQGVKSIYRFERDSVTGLGSRSIGCPEFEENGSMCESWHCSATSAALVPFPYTGRHVPHQGNLHFFSGLVQACTSPEIWPERPEISSIYRQSGFRPK